MVRVSIGLERKNQCVYVCDAFVFACVGWACMCESACGGQRFFPSSAPSFLWVFVLFCFLIKGLSM